jgi:dolichyl-phosphate beta-glucosyltransferase
VKLALSIIIPVYQEAARIERSLDELAAFLGQHGYQQDTEVLILVADSPDGTAKLAESKAKLFQHYRVIATGPRKGKGYQVRAGMMEAHGAYRLFMDVDLATPLHHLQTVRQRMEQGSEVIIAVRNLNSSHTGVRRWISSLGNGLVRVLLLPGIKDTQCGFKAFSAKAAEELFRRQTIMGWGFDMEILAIARRQGYAIDQIEAPDWSDKPNGTFDGEISSAAFETLGELLTVVWRGWTGRYRHKHFSYKPYRS